MGGSETDVDRGRPLQLREEIGIRLLASAVGELLGQAVLHRGEVPGGPPPPIDDSNEIGPRLREEWRRRFPGPQAVNLPLQLRQQVLGRNETGVVELDLGKRTLNQRLRLGEGASRPDRLGRLLHGDPRLRGVLIPGRRGGDREEERLEPDLRSHQEPFPALLEVVAHFAIRHRDFLELARPDDRAALHLPPEPASIRGEGDPLLSEQLGELRPAHPVRFPDGFDRLVDLALRDRLAQLLQLLAHQDGIDEGLDPAQHRAGVALLAQERIRVAHGNPHAFRHRFAHLGKCDRLLVHQRDDAVDDAGERGPRGKEDRRARRHDDRRRPPHRFSSTSFCSNSVFILTLAPAVACASHRWNAASRRDARIVSRIRASSLRSVCVRAASRPVTWNRLVTPSPGTGSLTPPSGRSNTPAGISGGSSSRRKKPRSTPSTEGSPAFPPTGRPARSSSRATPARSAESKRYCRTRTRSGTVDEVRSFRNASSTSCGLTVAPAAAMASADRRYRRDRRSCSRHASGSIPAWRSAFSSPPGGKSARNRITSSSRAPAGSVTPRRRPSRRTTVRSIARRTASVTSPREGPRASRDGV